LTKKRPKVVQFGTTEEWLKGVRSNDGRGLLKKALLARDDDAQAR
jgi:hypothetical protein